MDINNQNYIKHLQNKHDDRDGKKLQNSYSLKNDSEMWNSNFYKGPDTLHAHRQNQYNEASSKNSKILQNV